MNPVELSQADPVVRNRIRELLYGAPVFVGGTVPPLSAEPRSVWINEETGQFLIRIGNAWVEFVSGAQAGYSQITPVIQGVLWDVPATYNEAYVRRSHTSAFNTRVRAYDASTHPYPSGMRVVVRNSSPTHNMTILGDTGVTLNAAAGATTVAPGRNVTLLHVELNQWDLI